jgi:hypothetical protein
MISASSFSLLSVSSVNFDRNSIKSVFIFDHILDDSAGQTADVKVKKWYSLCGGILLK